VDVQIDALEGLEAGGVGLGEVADGDDGGHGAISCHALASDGWRG
jgi:hypothetical protein